MTPKIYFIIVTYNAMKWAEKCFSSIRKSSVPANVIVVDNGSKDGTQDFIKTNFPEVEFIQSSENLGFGKANNLGIEHAYKNGAVFFYLMNQDAWIFENSIGELLQIYQNHDTKSEIGILSPMHLDGTEKNLDIFLDKYIAHNFETRMISDFFLHQVKPYYELSFVNAAHWFLPKETVEKVGGFNPYFFHYGEDNEYVNRLRYHHKKILLCPKSKVVHDGKQVLDKVDYNKYKDYTLESRILNPNEENPLNEIKKSLRQSIFRYTMTGNVVRVKELQTVYQNISKDSKKLIALRDELMSAKNPFLNL